MENFTFCSPTEFVFGRDTENRSGELCKKYGARRVLVHFGGKSALASGLVARVEKSLESEGIGCVLLGGVQPNPKSGLVYEGIKLCRKEKIDFILAVGGGSVIDSAKAISAGVFYDGDFWDMYMGGKPILKTLPVGVVLTIPAAGSEGSVSSVITNEKTGKKKGAKSELYRPKFAIMNPAITATLPPYQCACGCTDIMAHVLERYFTNTPHVEVTDRLCEALLMTVIENAPKTVKNPADYEAQANIMWAGMLAHNNVAGVGREQDWASHGLAHELSAKYDAAHGATLAVMFPAWMRYTLSHDPARFAMLGKNVWKIQQGNKSETEIANETVDCFERFWHDTLKLPTSFAELGAKQEDIPHFLKMLNLRGATLGGFVKLTEADAEKIYKLAVK